MINKYVKTKRYLENGGKSDIGTVNGMPVVVNGQLLTTEECAKFANQAFRDAGYIASGNAWNSKGSDVIFNGYDTLQRPEQYDSLAVLNYNDAASDRVHKDFDSTILDKSRPYMVNMYYKGSPYLKKAYEEGTQGRTGTHTGYLVHNGKQWNVVHNIHGKAHVDKFTEIQGGKRKYGVTSIFAPRKNSLINNIKTRLGFKNGGTIHIAPSKKGTFTAAATRHGMGVQEFAARVLRNKDNYSPSLVKKANFARNASKWNH